MTPKIVAEYYPDVMVGRDEEGRPIYSRQVIAQRDVAQERLDRLLLGRGHAIELLETELVNLRLQLDDALSGLDDVKRTLREGE